MNPDFFRRNREALINMYGGELIVLTANAKMQLSNDQAAPFVQEANFWYLTGINEPNWLLVIDADRQSWLVAPEVTTISETFNGALSPKDARRLSGAEGVLDYVEYQEILSTAAKNHKKVVTIKEDPNADYYDFTQNPARGDLCKHLASLFRELVDCRGRIAALRAIKQPEEVRCLQEAINTTTMAFLEVKRQTPMIYEYEAEAIFNYRFRVTGMGGHAYDPIVAGGKNACTLHYNNNDDALPENGLLLMDVGAKVSGYAADITRTWAIGTPTPRQIAVHTAVEKAHHKIINLIKPGVSFVEYQKAVDEIMKDALQSLGLLDSRDDTKTYRNYFPHAISHGLGLDVHESLGGFGEFKPGMVLTVEPGIYIPEEGIGVRIEDDILVTETGRKNLSADLPTSL